MFSDRRLRERLERVELSKRYSDVSELLYDEVV